MKRARWWRREAPLSADEQAAVDAIVARARALPREAEPTRDLWQGIRNQIEHAAQAPARPSSWPARPSGWPARPSGWPARRPVWRARVSVPVWAASAATALVLAVSVGTGLWLGRTPSLDDPVAVRELADSLRERDGMSGTRHDLLALLDERRAQLPPDVVAAVEKNLGEIDRAIAEIHLAFQEHPDNASLRFLLAEAYRREADMLEQLEWWTSARGPEAQS